jgi:hypothetical protein
MLLVGSLIAHPARRKRLIVTCGRDLRDGQSSVSSINFAAWEKRSQ